MAPRCTLLARLLRHKRQTEPPDLHTAMKTTESTNPHLQHIDIAFSIMSVNSPVRTYDDANLTHFFYSITVNRFKLNIIIQLNSYKTIIQPIFFLRGLCGFAIMRKRW